jgi:hypothetical protein
MVDGRSYAAHRYCRPLSEHRAVWWNQRRRLRPRLFKWLRDASQKTVPAVGTDARHDKFTRALEFLRELPQADPAERSIAMKALGHLESGAWKPAFVLMHHDLWRGNILIDAAEASGRKRTAWADRFVFIDWAGSRTQGFAVYDLVRLAQSMKLPGRAFADELQHHCLILDCEPSHAAFHLAAALGDLGLHRDQFPLDRYVQLTRDCFAWLYEHGSLSR